MKKVAFPNGVPLFLLQSVIILLLVACDGSNGDTGVNPGGVDDVTYDVDANGIPRFVETDYIDLGSIYRISRFRSAEGHDYSDEFESCRSMKHYYNPQTGTDWAQIPIYSPVSGRVVRVFEEWAGTQVQITSDDYPAFRFVIFHIDLGASLEEGDQVAAGQQLGTHIGSQTMSDIAVAVNTPDGRKRISYFEVMSDGLFQQYQDRGVAARSDLIISKDERDADPLTCDGESFTSDGSIEGWVYLNPVP